MSKDIHPYDLSNLGRFDEAARAYREELSRSPQSISALSGLANALMGMERFDEAIPLLERAHAIQMERTPDSPGSSLEIAVCQWRSHRHEQARALLGSLCDGVLSKKITMAPDLAGGATYGLALLYMSVAEEKSPDVAKALKYLEKLNCRYEKRPHAYRFPKQVVRQVLGMATFSDVLFSEFGQSDLSALRLLSAKSRSDAATLKDALFYDAVIAKYRGDEEMFHTRLLESAAIEYSAGGSRWHFIQYELQKLRSNSGRVPSGH